MIQITEKELSRFRAKLEPSGECLLFASTKDKDGYGMFFVWREGEKLTLKAHRLAYQLERGPIAKGLHVLHRCDTPNCCNPRHLFLGKAAENMRDMARKDRGTKTPERPLGIRFHFNRWEAQVKLDGRSVYVGRFRTWQEAAALAAFRRNEVLFA